MSLPWRVSPCDAPSANPSACFILRAYVAVAVGMEQRSAVAAVAVTVVPPVEWANFVCCLQFLCLEALMREFYLFLLLEYSHANAMSDDVGSLATIHFSISTVSIECRD